MMRERGKGFGCIVDLRWINYEVPIHEKTLGYIYLPPLKRSWYRFWPDPQLVIYYVESEERWEHFLYKRHIEGMKNKIPYYEQGFPSRIELLEPSREDLQLASTIEYLSEYMFIDEQIPLEMVGKKLEEVLDTYPAKRD